VAVNIQYFKMNETVYIAVKGIDCWWIGWRLGV